MSFISKFIFVIAVFLVSGMLSCSSLNHSESENPSGVYSITSQELWSQYKKTPNTHPNIPNNSFAGYHQSDIELPSVANQPNTLNVKSFDAKGDGATDDTLAFQTALKKLEEKKNGGVLFVPEGVYKLSGMLRLGSSHMILRGAEMDKTILVFTKPLSKIYGPAIDDGASEYSWLGGLIHIGPKENFTADNKLEHDAFYNWALGDELAKVIQPAKRGDTEILVDTASELQPGQKVILTWQNPSDHSLLKFMAGPALSAYPWDKLATYLSRVKNFRWPVQIEAVHGKHVTLKQPLRMDIRPEWHVAVNNPGHFVEEDGVESLSIKLISGQARPHHLEEGYNGVFFHRAWNSWAKDISIEDADSGVLIEAAKNVTVTGLTLTGNHRMHHGTYIKSSHDCLIENFLIDTPIIHGINSDFFNTGNVWRKGILKHGTFDLHRGLPFDLIRTDITIHNDGSHGGDEAFGPLQGIHVVHWNIRATGRSYLVYEPDVMPMGALVGIQGVKADNEESDENHVKGQKGAIVADDGKMPEPSDLFQAELDFRHGKIK